MKRTIALVHFIMNIQHFTVQIIEASIAGVTYMDDFDFEERYTDLNECNPYYWHPLHLPEECLRIFEKSIRSGLKPSLPLPYSLVRERQDYSLDYSRSPEDLNEPFFGLSPFETLFELLRRDVNDLPRAPTLGISPYLGLMAMYKQPVSYKSAIMIEKLARAYANSPFPQPRFIDHDALEKEKKKKEINEKAMNTKTTSTTEKTRKFQN